MVLINLYHRNDPLTTITRAAIVMFVCWVIGAIVGRVLQQTIDQHIERYKQAHPIIDEHDQTTDLAAVHDDGRGHARQAGGKSAPQSA